MTVPTCVSGTLTNVLPHRNAMLQTQDITPHPVTVYRHGGDLCLQHGTPVWQHIGQRTTATSRHCCNMTSDVDATLKPNKQKINIFSNHDKSY